MKYQLGNILKYLFARHNNHDINILLLPIFGYWRVMEVQYLFRFKAPLLPSVKDVHIYAGN